MACLISQAGLGTVSELFIARASEPSLINVSGYKVLFSRASDTVDSTFNRQRVIAISVSLAYLSLLASAFSTKVYHVFLFQGVCLGISQGLGMPLFVSMPSQWFYRKRGLATGLAISGSGIGGGVGSLIVRRL